MKVLKQCCPKNLPNKHDMEVYNIKDRPVQEVSPLAGGTYTGYFYDVKETFPMEVEELTNEIQKCYELYEKCLHICKDIIEDEEKIKQSPEMAGALFEAYKSAAYSRFKNTYQLLSDDVFVILMETCQAYIDFMRAKSNEDFVCKGVHKYNTKDADNLIMILCRNGVKRTTESNKKLWGDRPELAEEMRYIIQHFDDLLPVNMIQTEFAFYQYALAKWADVPVIGFVEFFNQEYTGKWKASKKSNVNKQNKKYNRKSDNVKDFEFAIKNLLNSKKEHTSQTETA